jgi:hypothetical protein
MTDREPVAKGEPVARDTERFKLLFRNSRPHIPGGKLVPVSTRTTRELISERVQKATASQAVAESKK